MMNTEDLMRKKKIRMKRILAVFTVISLVILQSCEDVVDQIYENKQEQNAISPYR